MADSKFFKNFPIVPYRFGDNESPVSMQNLSVYIDTFEQVREEHVFYQSYYIRNNQRPDQLSYEVYGTTDYYWTLFLNNDHLRINGWPLPNSDLYAQAQTYYPNKVVSTNGVSTNGTGITRPLCTSEYFVLGATIWMPTSNSIATVSYTHLTLPTNREV